MDDAQTAETLGNERLKQRLKSASSEACVDAIKLPSWLARTHAPGQLPKIRSSREPSRPAHVCRGFGAAETEPAHACRSHPRPRIGGPGM